MLKVILDEINSIVILKPDGELTENDFVSAAQSIDLYIKKSGKLNGIIIYVETFPGWDSFSGFVAHLKFVKEHHEKVSYIAFVTDSALGSLAENVASHFVSAEIKSFPFDELEHAIEWIVEDSGIYNN